MTGTQVAPSLHVLSLLLKLVMERCSDGAEGLEGSLTCKRPVPDVWPWWEGSSAGLRGSSEGREGTQVPVRSPQQGRALHRDVLGLGRESGVVKRRSTSTRMEQETGMQVILVSWTVLTTFRSP